MSEKIQVDFKTAKLLDIRNRIWTAWRNRTDCSKSAQSAVYESWKKGELSLLIENHSYDSILYNVVEMADSKPNNQP